MREQRNRGGFRLTVDDTVDKNTILQLIGGLLRDDNTVRTMSRHYDGSTATILQQMSTVGEGGTQCDGSRLRIDRTTDSRDPSRLAIVLAIAQAQIHGWCLPDEVRHRTILCYEVENLFFGHAEVGKRLTVVSHGDQRLGNTAADERAHMPGDHRCHPTHRTLHLGIPQVVAGVHLLRLGLCQCCLSLQQGIVHGLHADATHHMTLQ